MPKGYISASQISLWEKDKDLYYRKYVLGEEIPIPRRARLAMQTGKDIARALENDTEAPLWAQIIATTIPHHDVSEKRIESQFDRNLKVLGYIDSAKNDLSAIIEYKTGTKYTQKMANDLFQIKLYAAMIWNNTKQIPKVQLVWIQTEWNGKEFEVIGEHKVFDVNITLQDILETMAHTQKIAKEIELYIANKIEF